MARVCAHTCAEMSRLGARGLIPALFTRMSAGPDPALCSNAAATLSASVTSQVIASASPPASRTSAAVADAPPALMSSTLTRAAYGCQHPGRWRCPRPPAAPRNERVPPGQVYQRGGHGASSAAGSSGALTGDRGGCPDSTRRTSSQAPATTSRCASREYQAECGVIRMRSSPSSGWPAGVGSSVSTSRAAPAMVDPTGWHRPARPGRPARRGRC